MPTALACHKPLRAAVLALIAGLIALPAAAQSRRISHCIAIADAAPGIEFLHHAAWEDPAPEGGVRIHYVGHATFLIRSPEGVTVATDYNGSLGATSFLPDVVTMNHAHETHWTPAPPAAIPHVLRGWAPEWGLPAEHHEEIGDMLIRNVPTDIRSWGTVEENGNSIFVFEVDGLCIGHLGHLHHQPNDAQYAALGRLDVVMAAVDGSMTINQDEMVEILQRLRSSVVIPMHWFRPATLERFLARMAEDFAIERPGVSDYAVSLQTLPRVPTVVVLEPRLLRE